MDFDTCKRGRQEILPAFEVLLLRELLFAIFFTTLPRVS